MNLIAYLIRSRQFFLTLWFLAYFFWVQPIILEQLAEAPAEKNITLGFVLIIALLMELTGIWLKFPSTLARVKANRSKSWVQFIPFLLVLAHIMITALLAFTTIKLFGVELQGVQPFWPTAGAIVFFIAILAKEGLFLGWWFQLMGAPSDVTATIPKAISPTVAETIGDGLLAIFGALAYTVVWEQIAADSFIISGTAFQLVLEYFGAALFFLMVFPATRILYYTEELLTQRPRRAIIASWVLFLATMIAALSTIPRTNV